MRQARIDDGQSNGRLLPTMDMLSACDEAYLDALLEKVAPEDRGRFMKYFMERTLGLALIEAVCYTLHLYILSF